ncbi:TPA: hypothetical protein PTV74_003301 [Clostridium botulinum]|nr:hypothetical protein [Clostridium botulinum]HDK7206456.1 hypothetical protein [Clostridium botulinum]HDK7210191.1 hypothetical protein [Clostridium botulinum]HDK7265641.1 hypothetical protein [Clostridium botulinum]HDK7269488.1 hypothetical protein [Clostridium botulinum]
MKTIKIIDRLEDTVECEENITDSWLRKRTYKDEITGAEIYNILKNYYYDHSITLISKDTETIGTHFTEMEVPIITIKLNYISKEPSRKIKFPNTIYIELGKTFPITLDIEKTLKNSNIII